MNVKLGISNLKCVDYCMFNYFKQGLGRMEVIKVVWRPGEHPFNGATFLERKTFLFVCTYVFFFLSLIEKIYLCYY